MINNLLIVCTGNICRSPMAWGLFKNNLILQRPDIYVDSAGTRALVGQAPTQEAKDAMDAIGIDISEHRAKQLTYDLVMKAELILVMEIYHKHDVINNFPSARGKTFLLGEWGKFEIPDPYQHSAEFFVSIRDMIAVTWNDWQKRIY